MRRRPVPVLVATALALAFAASALPSAARLPITAPSTFRAVTVNAPGQSGHVSAVDFAQDTAGIARAANPHLQDQLGLYSTFRYKDGGFFKGGTPTVPRPGVEIYRDAYGVPAVYGRSAADAWYGVAYALAADRMWQMHLLRMASKGRLSELIGTDGLEMDRATRRDGYSKTEIDLMLTRLSPAELKILTSYAAGVNQYIAEMHADPRKMPAEIAALSMPLEPWTPADTASLGVLMTRNVASDGGQELENAALLRDLVAAHGEEQGAAIFADLVWRNDPSAPSSVPAGEGDFSSYPHGEPAPDALDSSVDFVNQLPASVGSVAAVLAEQRDLQRKVRDSFGLPRGGSNAWAVGPTRSANGNAFLFEAPQVGYTVASLLAEFEIHGGRGADRIDAKGVTVAGVPVVGIGYNAHHGWGLTSGLSDTKDLYVETLVGDSRHYLFDGEVREMECRTEHFVVKNVLAPEQAGAEVLEVCRTVHGPVIAVDEAAGVAYSQRWAIWDREIETIRGLWGIATADSLAEVQQAIRLLTWNENLVYADRDGHIGFWHPGLYPARPRSFDERLPYPGTGEAEWERLLTPDEMPHVVDPAQGWVANWNSKPSTGWTSGDPHYSDRPWGQANRLDSLGAVLGGTTPIGAIPASGPDGVVTGTDGVFAPDVRGGVYDQTLAYFRPYLTTARAEATDPRVAQALDLMLAWDGRMSDGDGDGKVDHPGMTLFHDWVEEAAMSVFAPYLHGHGGFRRGSGHRSDPSPVINHFLRALQGPAAPLPQSQDYLAGESATAVVLRTVAARLPVQEGRFGTADMSQWLRSAFRISMETQGLAPGGTLPYQDRGSWIAAIEYTVR